MQKTSVHALLGDDALCDERTLCWVGVATRRGVPDDLVECVARFARRPCLRLSETGRATLRLTVHGPTLVSTNRAAMPCPGFGELELLSGGMAGALLRLRRVPPTNGSAFGFGAAGGGAATVVSLPSEARIGRGDVVFLMGDRTDAEPDDWTDVHPVPIGSCVYQGPPTRVVVPGVVVDGPALRGPVAQRFVKADWSDGRSWVHLGDFDGAGAWTAAHCAVFAAGGNSPDEQQER